MLTNPRLKALLEEARDISEVDFILFDNNGNHIAETFEADNGWAKEKVLEFINSNAENLVVSEYDFIKIIVRDSLEYILIAKSLSGQGFTVGRLVSAQIKNICELSSKKSTKTEFLNNIILGNIISSDIHDKSKSIHLEYEMPRILFVIEAGERSLILVKETLSNLINNNKDFLLEMQGKSLVLIKGLSANEKFDLNDYAASIVDTIQAEAMTRIRLGISNRIHNLGELAEAYKEANIALKVGTIFYGGRDVFLYEKLGIGRLINQLPLELCELFVKEVLGDKVSGIYDDENSNIIQVFFENNLNISETARQLYMHRNTLVYRLERIERNTGLDVRKFDDAIMYTIVKMVLKHIKHLKKS